MANEVQEFCIAHNIELKNDKPYIRKNKILCFDLETTGLSFVKDEILQISIIDGLENVLLNTYIKPLHRKTWKQAEAINHISPDMVKNAPHFIDIEKDVYNIFSNCHSLKHCCKHYKVENSDAHDSLSDAKATLNCFYKMMARKDFNKVYIEGVNDEGIV